MATIREQVVDNLIDLGFTQWRYDVGANRGKLSGSYRNYNLDMNIILYGCTYDIKMLSDNTPLVVRGDQFELLRNIENGLLK